jgi:outer membrane protein assembly complex protein YaeT
LKSVRPLVVVVSLFAAVIIARAQNPAADVEAGESLEGRQIVGIRFDPTDQPLPTAELERLLPFKNGTPLKLSDVRLAIQELYDTGRYADISITGEAAAPGAIGGAGGVVIRIATQFNFFVAGVSIDGVSEPPTKGQLTTAAKLELGTLFEDKELARAGENIGERLRANGLYHATVSNSVDRDPATEEAQIHFYIDSGSRARFDGVTVNGNTSRPLESIVHETRWRRGFGPITFPGWRNVTESLIQKGVARVLQSLQRGDHLQASVSLEKVDYHPATNTVTPSLNIESGRTLRVEVLGAKVSNGKLHQLIPIYEERALDRGLLVEGRRNLIEYFQSKGYSDAEVSFDENAVLEKAQVIDYQVTLKDRHKLMHIAIEGNRYFDDATLRDRFETTRASFPASRFGHYSQRTLDRDVDAIRELYIANGFRDVEAASSISDDYKGVHGHLGVRIAVREGPQWFVSKLELEGAPDSDLPYLHSVLQSIEGEPFSEANIAADRDSILSYYYNNGYSDAAFDWSQTPGPEPYRVNVRYIIHTGKREYTRAVLVRGLRTTRRSLVNRRIHLKPGDPISQSSIAQSQQQLYDLGIFSKVQTAIQNPDGEEDSKYVLFDLDEAKLYSFNAGIGAQLGRIGSGVTTFDEPAGTTGFVPRISLGVSRLNLFGEGRTLSLQTRFSTIEQRVLLSYTAPQFLDHDNLTLTISGLFDNSRDIRTFAARRYEGAVQMAQRLTRANSLQYRYTFRHVSTSDLVVTPELIPLLSQPEHVGMVSATFIQDRRDDPIDSHRGMYNTIDVGVSLRQFGSGASQPAALSSTTSTAPTGEPAAPITAEFGRMLMRNSTYHPIGRNIVIARTLQFGWIHPLDGLTAVPLAERFFAGGASSNRAFPDNQAGPRDLDTGFPLGGNALLMHSTELRFPLWGNSVGGVLFHDMGNVYDEVSDISFRFRQHNLQDFDYMVQSVGFGIRYRTPIGPIRVDFSLSPNSPRFFGFQGTFDQLLAGQGTLTNQRINIFQFHFSLGQTF